MGPPASHRKQAGNLDKCTARGDDGRTLRHRPETLGDPGLPADQGAVALRPGGAGAGQRGGRARLSDPRRHPDHAGRRGAPAARGREVGGPAAAAVKTNAPWPVELRLKRAEKRIDIEFDDGKRFSLPAEYLRVESPSAEVQGHGAGDK